jgi:hypothetical protein
MLASTIPLSYIFSPGFFETGSHYVAQTDLDLAILLSLPSNYWDYRLES